MHRDIIPNALRWSTITAIPRSRDSFTARVPFAERGGPLRGLLDLITGRYPLFLIGGSLGRFLPVFHLHEVEPEGFEHQLRHLAESGYQTVTTDAIAALVRQGTRPGPASVALCFDDARKSLWTVAGPLLKKYNFQAIVFAIPARIHDEGGLRPTIDDDPKAHERPASPFVQWSELRALHASGLVDVQSHSYAHASIFCSDTPIGFVKPTDPVKDPLDRPLISSHGEPEFLEPGALGAPLYRQRSRLSDARRFIDSAKRRQSCMDYVAERGGASFFTRSDWEARLRRVAGPGHWESDQEREQAIEYDLARSRAVLNEKLRTTTVRHLCFPWGVAGSIAIEAARRVGFDTAFSDRLFGFRAVRAGDDPLRLMRLNGKYLTRLPRRRAHAR